MKSKNPLFSRRKFIARSSLLPMAAVSVNPLAMDMDSSDQPVFPDDLTILFQGDSITDAGRNRAHYYANDGSGMGHGYVFQIVSQMLAHHPGEQLKCYNRGISGNKVFQLAHRWQEDCLQLQPDVLSILIGVNDFWHTLTNNYDGTPEVFDQDLRALLTTTLEVLPEIKIMLGEPFAVSGGTAISATWKDKFPPYQQAVRQIATDFKATFVPYQKVFDTALERAPASHWCPDGVHPSMAGAVLMKDAWLGAFHQLW